MKGHVADHLDLLIGEQTGKHTTFGQMAEKLRKSAQDFMLWQLFLCQMLLGEGAYPFCLFSNQKRSPFLMRSNWSSMMAVKTGPGPSSDSSSPPGKSSSFETSPSYSSATSRISCAQDTGSMIRIISVGCGADPGRFCRFYLWVGAVQLWVYLLERRDRRQIQTFPDLSVTSQAEVSSSLDGHRHQVCASEPQGSIHEV